MRFGSLVLYQGREYRLGKYDAATVSVVSDDINDLDRGFFTYAPGVFIKRVPRDEVEDVFFVNNFGKYQGVQVAVVQEKDGLLLVQASQPISGFQQCDKFSYEKWVRPEELDKVWEERDPL